ncbi:SixA phosphatase family protein [Kytococcus sp. Marseille-QA3725]
MPRELALVRHGEAVPSAPTDRERELTGTGRAEARRAGRELAGRWGGTDLVLHSDAVRTTQTWQEMAGELPMVPAEAVWPAPQVYEAGVPDLLQALADAPDEVERLLLVGHAPGVPALVAHLTGHHPAGWATGQVGVVELSTGTTWADLHEGCGTLRG